MMAAAAGVAAGIGIGILIAPSKGSRTRKRLKKQFLDLADLVQTEMSEKADSLRSVFTPDTKGAEPEEPEVKPEGEAK